MFDLRNLKPPDRDDLLEMIGLERKQGRVSSFFWAASFIGAGALLGAGVALLFAPKSGRELRQSVRTQLGLPGDIPTRGVHRDGAKATPAHPA